MNSVDAVGMLILPLSIFAAATVVGARAHRCVERLEERLRNLEDDIVEHKHGTSTGPTSVPINLPVARVVVDRRR